MVSILGIDFAHVSEDEAFARCVAYMEGDGNRVVLTAGPEFVMAAQQRGDLRSAAAAADLVTADGVGVVIASRWYGEPLPERVTGAELTERLLAYAARHGLRVFLLGAAEDSLQKALETVRARYPGVQAAGRNGYFGAADIPLVVESVRSFAPHLLLVGLGQPRQDLFIREHRESLGAPLAMGIGGVIDILGGTVKRAPLVWRRAHLEWLYRLVKEPRRFKRQLALPLFAWRAWNEARERRR